MTRKGQFSAALSDTVSNRGDAVFIGVDPGLGITGYGVIELKRGVARVIEAGTITSKRTLPLEKRLVELYDGLSEVFKEFSPQSVIIEDLYSHYKHPKTAIIMGHARGAVFLSAAKLAIPVQSYGATRIKKSLTGNGRASKIQMQKMIKIKLGLPGIPEPPDVADALAVALCHISQLKEA